MGASCLLSTLIVKLKGQLCNAILYVSAESDKAKAIYVACRLSLFFCCREFPGEVDKIRVWFRDYKTPDGKPQNKFGFNDKAMNKEFTLGVIKETSEFYQKLLSGGTDNKKGLALK